MEISQYLDKLAGKGRYHFTSAQATASLGSSPAAARAQLRRIRAKGRVVMPVRGFHLIVPPEYRSLGCLPADQFVPELMQFLGMGYYTGLLSAANLHGAAHQAPMVFQVVVASHRPGIQCGRVRVVFVARHNANRVPTVSVNTLRGVLRVSSPEATAFDLVGYPTHAGGLSNTATILNELKEKLDPHKLVEVAALSPLPWAQRLGHLLDSVDGQGLTGPLAESVAERAKEYVSLRAKKSVARATRDLRWRVFVNEAVEPDV